MYNAVQHFKANMVFPFRKTIPKSTALLVPSSVCMDQTQHLTTACALPATLCYVQYRHLPHLLCHKHCQTHDTTHSLANAAHSRLTDINTSFSHAKNDANPGGKWLATRCQHLSSSASNKWSLTYILYKARVLAIHLSGYLAVHVTLHKYTFWLHKFWACLNL